MRQKVGAPRTVSHAAGGMRGHATANAFSTRMPQSYWRSRHRRARRRAGRSWAEGLFGGGREGPWRKAYSKRNTRMPDADVPTCRTRLRLGFTLQGSGCGVSHASNQSSRPLTRVTRWQQSPVPPQPCKTAQPALASSLRRSHSLPSRTARTQEGAPPTWREGVEINAIRPPDPGGAGWRGPRGSGLSCRDKLVATSGGGYQLEKAEAEAGSGEHTLQGWGGGHEGVR